MFGKPEASVQELVTACVVRKEGAEVTTILTILTIINDIIKDRSSNITED